MVLDASLPSMTRFTKVLRNFKNNFETLLNMNEYIVLELYKAQGYCLNNCFLQCYELKIGNVLGKWTTGGNSLGKSIHYGGEEQWEKCGNVVVKHIRVYNNYIK